jgi:hypothetical protein
MPTNSRSKNLIKPLFLDIRGRIVELLPYLLNSLKITFENREIFTEERG